MNIEYKFLQKALEDKNYISFFYQKEKYTKIKIKCINELILSTNDKDFSLNEIKKIQILKERY